MKRISMAMLALAPLLAVSSASAAGSTPDCDCNTASVSKQKPKPKPKVRRAAPPKSVAAKSVPVVINEIQVQPAQPAINVTQTSGSDSCVSSAAAGTPGALTGHTWVDHNCVMLKNSAVLWSIGKEDAALALLCGNREVREALESTGTSCVAGASEPAIHHLDVVASRP